MHNDFSIFFSHQFFRTHILFSHIDNRTEKILQIHRKKNLLIEQKIKKFQSKATFAKNKKANRRIFFSKKRQHEKTSNSNVFDQNYKVRKQKKNIERQKISNIKTTTKNEKKIEIIKKN